MRPARRGHSRNGYSRPGHQAATRWSVPALRSFDLRVRPADSDEDLTIRDRTLRFSELWGRQPDCPPD